MTSFIALVFFKFFSVLFSSSFCSHKCIFWYLANKIFWPLPNLRPKIFVAHSIQNCIDTWYQNCMVWWSEGCLCYKMAKIQFLGVFNFKRSTLAVYCSSPALVNKSNPTTSCRVRFSDYALLTIVPVNVNDPLI